MSMLITSLSSPESRPPITVFFLLTFPVQTYKLLKGSSEPSCRNKGITDTREGLSTKLFFSDREKLQNRNDRQLLLEILIKAWIRNSRWGPVAAAPIWPAATAPQGPVPGNILWKGPSCPCMLFNPALYMASSEEPSGRPSAFVNSSEFKASRTWLLSDTAL